MKTILDKVDPKYIECSTGICDHLYHNFNSILWIASIILILIASKKFLNKQRY
jgi:hypothetical protein